MRGLGSAATVRVAESGGAGGLKCSSSLKEILAFSRWKEWHAGKLPLLLTLLLLLGFREPGLVTAGAYFGWYAAFALYLASGYMWNNLSDLAVDEEAGKPVHLGRWPVKAKLALTLLVAVSSFVPTLLLADYPALIVFCGCHALAITYSYPPRFKERVILGPLVASIAQLTAPGAVLVAATRTCPPDAGCLLLLMTLFGLRMIILHQILDGANDRQTGVATTVVRIGVNCARWFVRRMFAAELAVLITLVILLTRGQLAGLSLLLLGLPLLHVLGRRRHSLPVSLETYEHIPLADVYEMVLPLTAAARVIARHGTGHWWLALAVTLPFGRRHWQRLREIVSLWGGGSRE